MYKIIQKDNFNSNSDLYVDNNQVYKIYNKPGEITKYNINVLKKIFEHYDKLEEIEELVLPNRLLFKSNRVIGFSMNYIRGYTLEDIINNSILNKEEIKEIFIKILNLIKKFKKLPFDLYLGDLHEKNVIVDANKNIHVIDCDSFIIDNEKLTINGSICLGKYLNKYFDDHKRKYIKVNGDYISLLYMILFYLFKDDNIYGDDLINYMHCLIDDNFVLNLIKKSQTDINFKLRVQDIEKLFSRKYIIKQDNTNYQEIIDNEIIRIRRM